MGLPLDTGKWRIGPGQAASNRRIIGCLTMRVSSYSPGRAFFFPRSFYLRNVNSELVFNLTSPLAHRQAPLSDCRFINTHACAESFSVTRVLPHIHPSAFHHGYKFKQLCHPFSQNYFFFSGTIKSFIQSLAENPLSRD